jgi:hypothetical protein
MKSVSIKSALYCVIFCLFVLVAQPLRAQVAGGTLSGTITDPSGSAVPNAKVEVKNTATGVVRTLETNPEGYYTAVNLIPGVYEVAVSATGFDLGVKTGITINVGAQSVFNMALQVGTISNKIDVTTEAPTVQLTSSDISATVDATTVRELPLNGRSWTDLAALQPGVSTIQTQPSFASGADRGNRGFGQQLTISGARPQQNNYRLDGISLNDYANGAPGSVLGGNMGVDAIQEFSVLTSNYSAEYGKTSGGVVNAITRSGTNTFHGSGYEFLRNSALDARNFFEDPTAPKAQFRRNQFGGTIGGPIIKNRTFFFADYEGNRQSKGITNAETVPSLDVHNQAGLDPQIQKYLMLYPLANPSNCGSISCPFAFTGQQVVSENFFTTRIDQNFSDKDRLFGTYLYDKTPYNSPDAFGNVELQSLSSRQIVAVEETHTFTANFLNAIRFGYNHENVDNNTSLKAINPVAADTTLGSFPGQDASLVNIGGITTNPGGVGGLPSYLYRWNSFQVYDDAFWTKGNHSVKFGFAAERMLLQVTAKTDPNGVWNFTNLQSFLSNSPSRFQGGIVSGLTPRDLRQSLFGGYIQDDWRFRRNLTLNLGIRYEMTTVPTEINGKLANLINLSDPTPHLGNPFFKNPTTKNFEPRFGFSWDPFSNGRMAVRGGVGLFDVLPLPYQHVLLTTQASPFFQYTVVSKAGAAVQPLKFPDIPAADITANSLRSTYLEPNPKRNYVTQWNLNLQYQLTTNLAAMVAYVGSRGVHQPFRVDDANMTLPTKVAGRYVWPQVDVDGNLLTGPHAGNPPDTINSKFGSIHGMFYQGRSYFDALEFQLAKRMSHGFQVQGTFTWGKSIDTSSATVAGDAFSNSISSLNWFDPKLGRGLSDYNVGRTLVLNGTWDIPTPKSFSGPARWVADGWELGMIFTAGDGVPFTPTWGIGGDPTFSQSGDDFAYPDRLGGAGCQSLTHPGNPSNYIKTECFSVPSAPDSGFWTTYCDAVPPSLGVPINDPSAPPLSPLACFNLRGNAGRNIINGPGVTNLDFSVFKNNQIKRISETFNVQFRAEMFNVLNHPNFATPGPGDGNTDIFDATGALQSPAAGGIAGQLQRTSTPERQIQFAVKVVF